MVGELLANRYELLAKVGDGGMAQVFRARDKILNRVVAVKILRSQFANDDEFLERFRREAQAAASLAHPNVVNIYDVGDVGDTHFIVMEFVEGRPLNEIIQVEGALSEKRAVYIAYQIAQALAHAHDHGIIHRDIKPHNIIVTDDERVKVTDFGIARAMSSTNLTQTGVVLGSVHYFSPEQARGVNVGAPSDLYSLGIVLYEMVIGHVPFRGDTAIAVALQQIQEPPPAPSRFNEGISSELETVLLRLLAKDLDTRYTSAGQVLRDLQSLHSGTTLEDSRTDLAATRRMGSAESLNEQREVDDVLPSKRKDRRKKRKNRLIPLLFLVLLLVGTGYAAQRVVTSVLFRPEVVVPSIVGLSREEAETRLQEFNLDLSIDREVFDNEIPADHVISQEPAAQRRVVQGRTIHVRLSRGAEYVDMPSVEGLSLREARLNLTQAGFILGQETAAHDPEAALNVVLSQRPVPGQRVQKGTAVDLVVSKGEEEQVLVTVPDLRGLAFAAAQSRLNSLGLVLGNAWPEYSTSVPENQIIEQNPSPGVSVDQGWTVDFVYSQGPPAPADEPELDIAEEAVPESRPVEGQWHTADVRVSVPEGPEQEVVILVVDDFGAREVYRDSRSGGTTVSETVQGRGEKSKIQVYIGGRMFLDEYFEDLN